MGRRRIRQTSPGGGIAMGIITIALGGMLLGISTNDRTWTSGIVILVFGVFILALSAYMASIKGF